MGVERVCEASGEGRDRNWPGEPLATRASAREGPQAPRASSAGGFSTSMAAVSAFFTSSWQKKGTWSACTDRAASWASPPARYSASTRAMATFAVSTLVAVRSSQTLRMNVDAWRAERWPCAWRSASRPTRWLDCSPSCGGKMRREAG